MNEQELSHGAVVTPKNPDVILLKNVAGDSAPFDWNTGVDVTHVTGEITPKNQAGSFSCGGQAGSYFSSVLARFNSKTLAEKSAKFIYGSIAVPGGGSSDVEIMKRLSTVGDCDESIYPSYYFIGGQKYCDEQFMVTVSGISSEVLKSAGLNKTGKGLYVKRTLEDIAKAIRDNHGVILGVVGQNNGTWFGAEPKPPVKDEWAHWVYAGKAVMRNGKPMIGFINSWGEVGEKGWQYIGEEYMPHLFTAFTFGNFEVATFKHTFKVDMQLGNKSDEVKALQDALKLEGVFDNQQLSTGYFGPLTLKAVKAFQQKEIITPVSGYVGPKTRARLNQIFS